MTLRLARPIHFESITIDHAPLLLLGDAASSLFSRGISSAPRHFQIIGYPPSTNSNTNPNHDWGFDTTKGKILSTFEFDPSSQKSSSQTFERMPDLPQEGSCSEVKPTCGSDDDSDPAAVIGIAKTNHDNDDTAFVIAGIKIEIVGNWGNPDYTCFYRARLQGSLVGDD